jgi:hypothetical protein
MKFPIMFENYIDSHTTLARSCFFKQEEEQEEEREKSAEGAEC